MKHTKRLLTVLLMALLCAVLVLAVSAEGDVTIVDSGYCGGEGDGTNLTWTLDSEGTLIISGTGEMERFDIATYDDDPSVSTLATSAPWGKYHNQIKSVVTENGVTNIGPYAFYGCHSIARISFSNSVASFGASAFKYCDALTNISIPNSVTFIEGEAFSGCTSLANVTIPDNLEDISERAFLSCSSLSYFSVDFNNSCFSSDDFGCLYNKDKTVLLQYPIGNTRISFAIPASVTSIGAGAFYSCDTLTSISIPDSVTTIHSEAFSRCGSLTNISIPDSVTSMEGNAFSYCTALTSVTISKGLTNTGWYAFSGCTALADITIPDNITHIDWGTFS